MSMDFNHTEVVAYPGQGNGIAAVKDLVPGEEIILVNEPYHVIVERAALDYVCSQCIHDKEKLSRCGGCKVLYYCSKKCQIAAWKAGHRLECAVYQRLPDIPSTEVRALMSLLLQKKLGSRVDPGWASLVSHIPELKKRNRWDDIVLQAKAAVGLTRSSADCIEPAIELLCRMSANAFQVTMPEGTQIGFCFEPTFSLANHSCSPNAFVMFDGRKMYLRALDSIKKGDQVYLSYIDTSEPLATRRSKLQNSYFFHCECQKCAQPSNPPDLTSPLSFPRLELFIHPRIRSQSSSKLNAANDYHDENDAPAISVLIIRLAIHLTEHIDTPQPHHPRRVRGLVQILAKLQEVSDLKDDELLAGVGFLPKKLLLNIDYQSAAQIITILILEIGPLCYGPSSPFLRKLQSNLERVEDIQRIRGDVGQKLKQWSVDEHSEGQVYAKKIFESLRELASYGEKVADNIGKLK